MASPLWPVLALAAAFRIPLLLLPGAGRDEATYFYWGHHFEPAYAPLLQLFSRFSSALPLPEVLQLRLPSFMAGMAALVLFDALLRNRRASRSWRLMGLLAVALSPWQTYAGSILHPDALLLCFILAFLLAIRKNRYLPAAVLAGLAVWSKPTGILLLFPLAYLLFRSGRFPRGVAAGYAALAGGIAAPVLLSLDWPMIQAIAEFGKMAESASLWQRLLVEGASALLLGGLLLPVALRQVRKSRWREWVSPQMDVEKAVAGVTALTFGVVFGGAVLITGQVKGNWILPACVILWPAFPERWGRKTLMGGILATGVVSLALVGAFRHPEWLRWSENRIAHLGNTYVLQAGTREYRVSASHSWSDRVREYRSMGEFAGEIRRAWEQANPTAPAPRWIVSDDYGLAAQVIFCCRWWNTSLIIPGDGIFCHTLPGAGIDRLPGGAILILGVHGPPEGVWPRLRYVKDVVRIRHPICGVPVGIAVSDGVLRKSTGITDAAPRRWREKLIRWLGVHFK